MTQNQLRYWELQETIRANTEKEKELNRSHLEQEKQGRTKLIADFINAGANAVNAVSNMWRAGTGATQAAAALAGG